MKRASTVWVKNNGAEAYCDRFDGEDFEVPPGEAIEMYAECAALCLGFGEDDKTRAVRRLGWAPTEADMKRALERLGSFSFHMTEKEANGHSSAPVGGGEASGVAKAAPGAATPHGRRSLLEKLAPAAG